MQKKFKIDINLNLMWVKWDLETDLTFLSGKLMWLVLKELNEEERIDFQIMNLLYQDNKFLCWS